MAEHLAQSFLHLVEHGLAGSQISSVCYTTELIDISSNTDSFFWMEKLLVFPVFSLTSLITVNCFYTVSCRWLSSLVVQADLNNFNVM